MKREYFYRGPKGEALPYHYCSDCDKRFTDEEFKKGLLIAVGLESMPIKLCKSPCYGIKFPTPVKKNPEWALRTVDSEEVKPKPGRPKHGVDK